MGLFILVKRKGKLLGVIPAEKRATSSQLKKLIRTQIKKGFTARVVNQARLRTILKRMLPARVKRLLRKGKVISQRRRKQKRRSTKKKSTKRKKR